MLVFQGERKLEYPAKNPARMARTNENLNSHMATGRNRTLATLVEFAFLSGLEGSRSWEEGINDRASSVTVRDSFK